MNRHQIKLNFLRLQLLTQKQKQRLIEKIYIKAVNKILIYYNYLIIDWLHLQFISGYTTRTML